MNFLSSLMLLTVLTLATSEPDTMRADQATPTFPVIDELEKRALLSHMIQQNELDEFPDRIIGGEDANETDAPFQIALHQKYFGFFKRFLCGGSLISARTVLSAGHCVIK